MKKTFALILALAMMATLSVSAFAATNTGGNTAIDISATFKAGTAADDVISVDVEWGTMTFEYTDGAEGRWDPATHTNGAKGEGTWTQSGNVITVTNHSNVAVTANLAFAPVVDTVTGEFGNATIELASAVGTALADAPTASTALTLGGSITEAQAGKVGTVTVSISKNR